MADISLTLKNNNPGKLLFDPTDRYVIGNANGYGIYHKPWYGIAAMLKRFYDMQANNITMPMAMLMEYFQTNDSNNPTVLTCYNFLVKNTNINMQNNIDFTDYKTVVSWAANLINFLNSGLPYEFNVIVKGCALSLNVSSQSFAEKIQPTPKSWNNGYTQKKTRGYVSVTDTGLSGGGGSVGRENTAYNTQNQYTYIPYVQASNHVQYYFESKDITSQKTQTEILQPGTRASSPVKSTDNQASLTQQQAVKTKINELDLQLANLSMDLSNTPDLVLKSKIENNMQLVVRQRQEQLEYLISLQNSDLTKSRTQENYNLETGLSQHDIDASIISDNQNYNYNSSSQMPSLGSNTSNDVNKVTRARLDQYKQAQGQDTKPVPITSTNISPSSVSTGGSLLSQPLIKYKGK